MEVYQNTKIYIVSPPHVVTGGTEALHHLGYMLRNCGYEVYMVYRITEDPKMFQQYHVPMEANPEDAEHNIFIVPEALINFMGSLKYARVMIYWLSVDNFLEQMYLKVNNFTSYELDMNYMSKIKKEILNNGVKFNFNREVYHLAQSEYARQFLIKSNIDEGRIFKLIEPISDKYYEVDVEYSCLNRDNFVLYNPQKGLEYTKLLKEASQDIDWVPIISMTQDEVIRLMLRSKVYIDFGSHPGRDRIPREAALMGCCVITGLKGSARYFEDVSIDMQYKFLDIASNVPKIIDKIHGCLTNYDEEISNFNQYRQIIKNDRETYQQDITDAFKKCY